MATSADQPRLSISAAALQWRMRDRTARLTTDQLQQQMAAGLAGTCRCSDISSAPGDPNARSQTRPHLSETDKCIVLLLAQGRSNSEIGFTLAQAEQTIKNRMSLLLLHFRVNNRAAVVLRALQHGFLSLDDLLPMLD